MATINGKRSLKPKPFDLEECAARIRVALRGEAAYRLNVGRELLAAKQALPHGTFSTWIKSKLDMSVRTAQNYMAMARLAEEIGDEVLKMPAKDLYAFASAKVADYDAADNTETDELPQEPAPKAEAGKNEAGKNATIAHSATSPLTAAETNAWDTDIAAEGRRNAAREAADLLRGALGTSFDHFVSLYDEAGDEFTPALHGK